MSKVALNELCKKGSSSLRLKDITNDGPYPVYGASGIVGYSADYQNENRYVAVIKDGAGVGRACVCEPKSSVLGTMQALLPSDGVDCDYLLYLVRSMKLGDGFTGSTIPHIYFKDYGKCLLVEHNESEQRRIADLLHVVERLQSCFNMYHEKLDTLVKSRFVEMFGDPIEDEKWPKIKLDELCSKLGSGATPRGGKSAYKDTGIPLVRSMNVHNGAFIWKDLAYIDDEQADRLKGVTLRKGDVLLNITGASVARSCLLPDELAGGRVNQHVAIVRPDPSVIVPIFLNSVFICDSYQHFLLDGSQMAGATREAITKQDLRAMQVPTPPLALQQEFAAFVQQVDKLKFNVQQSIDKLQMLYDSLAQEYFSVEE